MSKNKHNLKGLVLKRDGEETKENKQPEINVKIDASELRNIDETKNKNPQFDIKTERENFRKEETIRVREIQAIAERHKGMGDLKDKAIAEGTSVDEFRALVLERLGKIKPVETDPDIGMTDREISDYSFVRAINAAASGDWSKAGLERQASEAMAKKLKRSPNGFFVPTDVVMKRDLTVGVAADGGNLVGTNLLAASFIDLLRNKMLTAQLGATILTGLIGDVAIPSQSGGALTYWVAEDTDITLSDPEFGQVEMDPKTVGALTVMSRKLLIQSSPDVENLVRSDLQKAIALAIDKAAIAGSGTGAEPTGIINQSGIGAVAGGTDGLAPEWSHIVDLESEVAADNADIGSIAYLTNAKVRGKLKQTEKAEGTAQFVWENNPSQPGEGSLNGYKAGVSNQVPSNLTKGSSSGICSAIIFGNFADLLIAYWSGLDVIVDPFTYSSKGSLKIVVLQDCDVAVRHAVSFAAMLDALTD